MPELTSFELRLRGEVCLAVARPASPNWELHTRDAISGHEERRFVRGPFDAILLETLKTSYFGVRAIARGAFSVLELESDIGSFMLTFNTRSELLDQLPHELLEDLPETVQYLNPPWIPESLRRFHVAIRHQNQQQPGRLPQSMPASASDLRDCVQTAFEEYGAEALVDIALVWTTTDGIETSEIISDITPSNFYRKMRVYNGSRPEAADLIMPVSQLALRLEGPPEPDENGEAGASADLDPFRRLSRDSGLEVVAEVAPGQDIQIGNLLAFNEHGQVQLAPTASASFAGLAMESPRDGRVRVHFDRGIDRALEQAGTSQLAGPEGELAARPPEDVDGLEAGTSTEYMLQGASVNCDGERLEMPISSERVMLADVLAAAAVYADHGFFPVVRLRLGPGWGDDVTVIKFSAPKEVLVPAEFLKWAADQDIEPEALQWIERMKPEFAPGRMPAADLAGLEGEVLVPLEVCTLSGWAAALFLLVERSPGIYNAAAAFGRPGETDWEALCELARKNLAAGRSAVFSTGGTKSCGETARSWVEAKLVGEEPRCQVAGELDVPEWLSPAPLPVPHEVAELLGRLAETRIEDSELAEQVRRMAALASPVRRTTRQPAVCPVPRTSELPDASMLGVCAEEGPARHF